MLVMGIGWRGFPSVAGIVRGGLSRSASGRAVPTARVRTCVNTLILDTLYASVTDRSQRVAARRDLHRITDQRSREAPPRTAEIASRVTAVSATDMRRQAPVSHAPRRMSAPCEALADTRLPFLSTAFSASLSNM